jgi:hypothetical protein
LSASGRRHRVERIALACRPGFFLTVLLSRLIARVRPTISAKACGLLPNTMPPWVLHDLRRTARSLMSRAGVRPTFPNA